MSVIQITARFDAQHFWRDRVAAFVPRTFPTLFKRQQQWRCTAAVGSKNPPPGKILLRMRKIIRAGVSGIKRAARFGIHACARAHEWHSFSPFTDSALLWLMLALPPLARDDGAYSRERKTGAENEKQHGTNTGRLRAADRLCAAGPD